MPVHQNPLEMILASPNLNQLYQNLKEQGLGVDISQGSSGDFNMHPELWKKDVGAIPRAVTYILQENGKNDNVEVKQQKQKQILIWLCIL